MQFTVTRSVVDLTDHELLNEYDKRSGDPTQAEIAERVPLRAELLRRMALRHNTSNWGLQGQMGMQR